jgi:hypothetical protein
MGRLCLSRPRPEPDWAIRLCQAKGLIKTTVEQWQDLIIRSLDVFQPIEVVRAAEVGRCSISTQTGLNTPPARFRLTMTLRAENLPMALEPVQLASLREDYSRAKRIAGRCGIRKPEV